jgi:hypothetical protein
VRLPTVSAVDVDLDTRGTSKVSVDSTATPSTAQVQAALDAVGNFAVVA